MRTADTFLSVITILEIERGAWSVERRDKSQGKTLRARIDHQVLLRFDGRAPNETP